MKTACVSMVLLATAVSGFAPALLRNNAVSFTSQFMFGGTGSGIVEDDPEKMKAMEDGAKALGMSVDEYQLGLRARERMTQEMNEFRGSAGSGGVTVERDGNSPSAFLDITITEEGKGMGKVAVEKEIIAALEKSNEVAKVGRETAQKNMMVFIQEQMK